jgi:hypothetical protein
MVEGLLTTGIRADPSGFLAAFTPDSSLALASFANLKLDLAALLGASVSFAHLTHGSGLALLALGIDSFCLAVDTAKVFLGFALLALGQHGGGADFAGGRLTILALLLVFCIYCCGREYKKSCDHGSYCQNPIHIADPLVP